MKAIITIVFASLIALTAAAKDPFTHYPRHQIGAGNGLSYATDPSLSEMGRIGLMGKHRTAMNLSFNYQFYFNRHWGLNADILFPNYSGENPEKWIPRVEGLGPDHFFADMSDEHWKTYSTYQCNISLGAIYRVSRGPWSLQPSVGVGVSLFNGNENIDYYALPPGADQTQWISMTFDSGSKRQCMVSLNLSVMFWRRLSKWFSIWLKPSYIVNFGHIAGHYRRIDDISKEVIEEYHTSERPGNFFNLQLGISLTINEVCKPVKLTSD